MTQAYNERVCTLCLETRPVVFEYITEFSEVSRAHRCPTMRAYVKVIFKGINVVRICNEVNNKNRSLLMKKHIIAATLIERIEGVETVPASPRTTGIKRSATNTGSYNAT